tara:strand:- start:10237 stop:11289 length:1053 start_codon:yes stop_codon:yes gene_type:complete
MSVSTELINTTLEDLRGPMEKGFMQSIPLWAALEKKGKVSKDGGTYIARSWMKGASAKGTGMFNGDEALDLTRYQKSEKYEVEPHRVVIPVAIPKKELLQNTGKSAAVRLIEEYPKAALEGAALDLNSYMLSGVSTGIVFPSAELSGFVSLNGQFTGGVGRGVTNGLLDFQTPATQTDTVQNVAKAVADWHYNQYGDISAFLTDGMQILRQVYRKAAHFCSPGKGPDLIVMDDATFGNFQLAKQDIVRIQVVGDNTDKGNMVEDVLGMGGVYSDPTLDIANDFTGVAADGVTYMLTCDFIELVLFEKFSFGKFAEPIGAQDAILAKAAMQGNLICRKFPAQGCVSGGSVQ